jgi:hypothetical protein
VPGGRIVPQTSTPLTAAGIVGDLLAHHPDAASLLSEASHRYALADESARVVLASGSSMLAARRRWDDLRHRIDPRGSRTLRFRPGLAALVLIAACLVILDVPTVRGALGANASVPLALCATATWLIAAWRGALASREQQRRLRVRIVLGTGALSGLLLMVHLLSSADRHATRWHHVAAAAVAVIFINALTAGASALIARLEPSVVADARANWLRARRSHAVAVRQERRDAEAASAAESAWLDLVRSHAARQAKTDAGHVVVLAKDVRTAALQALGRPALASDQIPGP